MVHTKLNHQDWHSHNSEDWKLYPQRWLLSKHAVLGNYFRSIKITLDPQLLLNISLTWPCPPERQSPAPPIKGQGSVPPTRKPAQVPWTSLTQQGQSSERRTTVLQPVDHKHRKSDKMRQRRTMFQKKEQYKTPQE